MGRPHERDNVAIMQAAREQRLADELDLVIYPNNDPTQPFGEDKLEARTIREAVSEIQAGFDENAIPEDLMGAKRLTGEIDLMLRERHLADVTSYSATGKLARNGSLLHYGIEEVAGRTFAEEDHVPAFGYYWYRKYTFDVDGGKLIVYQPSMQPWYQGGSPFPRAYAVGEVDMLQAQAVVFELSAA